jgi:hypothetical protein
MLQSILHCLPFMAKLIDQNLGNFLGRAVQIAPWQKVNNPDQTPWQNENETHRHPRRFYATDETEINFKQKNMQFEDPETAWNQQIEELRAVENSLRPTTTEADAKGRGDNVSYDDRRVVDLELDHVERDNRAERRRTVDQLIPYTKSTLPRQHTRRDNRLFPSTAAQTTGQASNELKMQAAAQLPVEVKRSWPEPRTKNERRMTAANYSAVEIHGFYGLIDDGSEGAGRMLVVHVPKWVKGFFMDIKQGDTIHVYHARGKKIGAALTVLATGRHKYYGSGRRVTTCTICVPEVQWVPFTH